MNIKDQLFGSTRIPLLGIGLDAFALRHRAISDNVANTETQGYTRREVKFEEKLRELVNRGGMVRTDDSHLGGGGITKRLEDGVIVHEGISFGESRVRSDRITAELLYDHSETDVNDLNNVDIDREMGDMASNHLKFNYAARMDKAYFDLIKTAIRGA